MTYKILQIHILKQIVSQIYPTELQLNKATYFDTFLDLDLFITKNISSI